MHTIKLKAIIQGIFELESVKVESDNYKWSWKFCLTAPPWQALDVSFTPKAAAVIPNSVNLLRHPCKD